MNDQGHTDPPFQAEIRRGFERLLRKLLAFPRSPAVVLLHHFSWHMHPKLTFWSNAEREFNEFALYYGLPTLSVKAATYHLMAADVDGFSVTGTRSVATAPKHKFFYFDRVHPDGNTGAR